jgi:hypothetical protein
MSTTDVLFESWGPLRYSIGTASYKLVVEVDKGIVNYYRDLLPKYIYLNRQMYAPHISVIRHEVPPNLEHWGKYEGEEVRFFYKPSVRHGTVYYWLDVFCVRLEEIRLELGLPVSSPYTRPPDGFSKCFHCTIGNVKQLDGQ